MIDVLIRCPYCFKVLRFFRVEESDTEKVIKAIQHLAQKRHRPHNNCSAQYQDKLGLERV